MKLKLPKDLNTYQINFRLNMINFKAIVKSKSKIDAKKQLMFNINMNGLKRLNNIDINQI